MSNAYIIGSGMSVASREVSNEDLCRMFPALATSNEWLIKNVGVKKRYLADTDESLTDLLYKAGAKALNQAGVKKIDRLIVGSNTQAKHYPATASEVAKKLKTSWDLSHCWCLDIQNGCPAGMAAVGLGVDAILTGQAECVLAIGGDVTSRMVDWFDRNTSLLLGDGASAFVLTHEKNADSGGISLKVLSHCEQTDYESSDIMQMASSMADYSPFEISNKTKSFALKEIRRITGLDTLPAKISKELAIKLHDLASSLRRKAFPETDGRFPYKPERYPYFNMAGADVLEKIRRIVPDCGYLQAFKNAHLGQEIFEEYKLQKITRVSDIPSEIRKTVLKALGDKYNLLIPHQANLRAHQNISKALAIPMNKVYSNIADYANTSGAAAGIALYESLLKPSVYYTIRGSMEEITTPQFEPGQRAMVLSFGAGTNVVYLMLERCK